MISSFSSQSFVFSLGALLMTSCGTDQSSQNTSDPIKQPNILIAISDDQSYPHASVYGSKMLNTPAFDRVAAQGVLFTNAYVASPGCAPSRAALLTGMNCWQIEEAGTHGSRFPLEYTVYPDILEEADYYIGYTQKGWSPGDWEISGRNRNPAGNRHNVFSLEPPTTGIVITDYAANFIDFMEKRPEEKPFYFWYGSSEPHRVFEKGSGMRAGKDLQDAEVPGFLPDTPEIRSDLLDYALEIEWFDEHLGKMIDYLEENGELQNTIIVVTSDNGMAFPRAKANLYDHGIRVPLAVMWGENINPGTVSDELVSLLDLKPTFLEAAGIELDGHPHLQGKSLIPLLKGEADQHHDAVFASRERHSSSRWQNLGYPQRSIRTDDFLYIRNFKPERWPAGAPVRINKDGSETGDAYHDIDACPTMDFLVDHKNNDTLAHYFDLSVQKRPAEEFFDIKNDPYCLQNLYDNPEFKDQLNEHRRKLGAYLMETNDPRVTGKGDIFESYPRLRGPMREFPRPDWVDEKKDLLIY
ncbi:MAG: sulfatase [Bacteroidales bacterium]